MLYDSGLFYQFKIGLRLVPPVRDQDQVPTIQLRNHMLQLRSVIVRAEVTVVMMLSIAQLALLPIIEKHARLRGRVIEHLQLVQVIANVFTVVLHGTLIEKGFILGLEHRLFIIARITAVWHFTERWTEDDRSEKSKDALLHLPYR